MAIDAEVKVGATTLCRRNKHGHFTTFELHTFLRSQGSILTLDQVSWSIQRMKNKGMFRPYVQKKFRNGFVIRELLEKHWKEQDEKICKRCMSKDATIVHLRQQMYDLKNEIFAIKSAWRNLHNVLRENR